MREYIKEMQQKDFFNINIVSAYKELPAYMEKETTVGKKEGYSEIIARFKELRKYLYEEKTGLFYTSYDKEKKEKILDEIERNGGFHLEITAFYLCALIDTMEVMAQEIFELYKILEELLKEGIKGILKYYNSEVNLYHSIINQEESEKNPLDFQGTLLISYVILKACRMKILLKEKYQPIAEVLYQSAMQKAKEEGILEQTEEMKMAAKEYERME